MIGKMIPIGGAGGAGVDMILHSLPHPKSRLELAIFLALAAAQVLIDSLYTKLSFQR